MRCEPWQCIVFTGRAAHEIAMRQEEIVTREIDWLTLRLFNVLLGCCSHFPSEADEVRFLARQEAAAGSTARRRDSR
jgi:hypothetical protein